MTEDGRGRRPTKAETSAETRASLLEAGADLLREQPVGDVLTQVKARLVAQRAGRTIGAFYHHWDTQDAYQRDLLAYVLDPARIPSTGEAVEAVAAGFRHGLPAAEMLRVAARQNFESVQADPYVPLWSALWARHTDDHVRTLLHDHYGAVTAQLLPVYEALFAAFGRVPRPPFTTEMFAVAVTALNQGLAMRVAIEPGAVPVDLPAPPAAAPPEDGDAVPAHWDLFGALVLTLLDAMTEPASAEGAGGVGT
jgi:AcrR family transcriptional regulator